MSTTIAIDIQDLAQCLARLASQCLYLEAHQQSSINIKRGIWRLTETNPEVHAMWTEAQRQAQVHHGTVVPIIHAMREEIGGKRIIEDQPQTHQQ